MFIGTIESISNAKVLLEYLLVHLKVCHCDLPSGCVQLVSIKLFRSRLQEVELLRQEKLEIDQQLRAIHGASMQGSMRSFTTQRRSDRGGSGYNNDVDSMRPSRGNANNHGSGNASMGLNAGGSSMRGRPGRGRGNNTRFHPGNNSHKHEESSKNDCSLEQTMQKPSQTYRSSTNNRDGVSVGNNIDATDNSNNRNSTASEPTDRRQSTTEASNP